jgi:hypothetical protein
VEYISDGNRAIWMPLTPSKCELLGSKKKRGSRIATECADKENQLHIANNPQNKAAAVGHSILNSKTFLFFVVWLG